MSASHTRQWPENENPTPSLLIPPEPRWEDAGPLAGRLAGEMAAAWRRGERPPVEDFLAEAPAFRGRAEVVLRLLREEIGLRRQEGEVVRVSELARRFPDLRDEVENLVAPPTEPSREDVDALLEPRVAQGRDGPARV